MTPLEVAARAIATVNEQDGAAPWDHPITDRASYMRQAEAAFRALSPIVAATIEAAGDDGHDANPNGTDCRLCHALAELKATIEMTGTGAKVD